VGGTATTDTLTAGTAAFVAADVYTLQQALPPRFQPRASFLSSNTTANTIWRFVATGSTTEAVLFNDDRSRLLGKPWRELSTLVSTTSSGSKILAYGDFQAAYRIIDRVGLSVELVPHLFGSNRRPTGQRGLYCYGRTGGGVVIPNALRVLKVR
jgi:HK97 family phage major capsid protein